MKTITCLVALACFVSAMAHAADPSPTTTTPPPIPAAIEADTPALVGNEPALNLPSGSFIPDASDPAAPKQVEQPPIAPVVTTVQAVRTPQLWDRIRQGFTMSDLDSDLVRNHEQWYSSRPDYIARMTDRSSKYLFHIVEELELRNMPAELALLPFIESAFNPQAMSSAKAAGMWQFVPGTGRDYKLKQNLFRDDRRDVQASTRAALDYLQKLHRMFGDWQLALAAYNWGEGSVGRAIAKNQRLGLGVGYNDLDMPAETRNYVPKLQAVKNIVANPDVYNTRLPDIANHPYFVSVNIPRDIDLAVAARLAEINMDDFRSLNPSANKPVLLASGTPQILLPWDNAAVYERNFAAHQGQLASWTVWRAPHTLKPADVARRFGMSDAAFRSLNNIPPRMLIKAGSSLLIPRSTKVENDVSSHTADNAQISFAPEIVLRKTTVKARKGDTVASIAKRYNVSTANVAQWNKVAVGGGFKANQPVTLNLPVKARSAKAGMAGKSALARSGKTEMRKSVQSTAKARAGMTKTAQVKAGTKRSKR